MHSFSPLCRISPLRVTLSAKRGARRDAVGIVRIVVVDAAAGVDIYEIVGITRVGRTQPPHNEKDL